MQGLISGLDKFNDSISQNFCPMTCMSSSTSNGKNFNGNIAYRPFSRGIISQVSSDPIVVQRTKQDISSMTDAYYIIKFQMKGQGTVRQSNREAKLNVGDFVICSTSEPYQLEFEDNYQQTVFTIPQVILQNMFHSPDDYIGMRMGNEVPTHGIISQFVYSVTQRMDLLEPETLQSMEANLLNLLITSLKAEKKLQLLEIESSPEQHFQQVKRFIAMHIKDYRLSVDFIAQAENISKRYLHMLFKDNDVSISRYIQQLRLEGCYKDLINNEFRHLATSDIALDWGFGDVSHFYRCFKLRYSLTPKQLRMQAKAGMI